MKLRRLVAVLAVSAFVLTGASCSNDDDKTNKANGDDNSEQTNGSAGSKGDSGDADDAGSPDTTVTDEEFDKQFKALSVNIEAAGNDVCKLMTAAQSSPPEPANKTQTEQFVAVWAQLLKAIGSSLGGDDEKILSKAADEFSKAAADNDYSPDILEDDELMDFLAAPELSDAMDRFGEKAMACITDGGVAGDDTEG